MAFATSGRIPVQFELTVGGAQLKIQAEIPERPAQVKELLPIFRACTDGVVRVAVHTVETAGRKVSCQLGCAACCRQLVPLSAAEAYRLHDVIAQMPPPQRSAVMDRFAAARVRLDAAGLLPDLLDPRVLNADDNFTFAAAYYHLHIDCPFLENEQCSIYAERPLRCREYLVVSPPANCFAFERNTIEGLVLPNDPSAAVMALEPSQLERPVPWVPLIVALEWVENHPESAPRPGQEILCQFLEEWSQAPVKPTDHAPSPAQALSHPADHAGNAQPPPQSAEERPV